MRSEMPVTGIFSHSSLHNHLPKSKKNILFNSDGLKQLFFLCLYPSLGMRMHSLCIWNKKKIESDRSVWNCQFSYCSSVEMLTSFCAPLILIMALDLLFMGTA